MQFFQGSSFLLALNSRYFHTNDFFPGSSRICGSQRLVRGEGSFPLPNLSNARNQSHVRQPRASWLLVSLCPRPSFPLLCLSATLIAHPSFCHRPSMCIRFFLFFVRHLPGPPLTLPRLYRFLPPQARYFLRPRKKRQFRRRTKTRRRHIRASVTRVILSPMIQ